MYTIDKRYQQEFIINKSRFICYLSPAKTVDEANMFLQEIRKKHYDATHNCYSYIIGYNGEISKSSDDGEPSQTAGIPINNVLKQNDLTNIIAIVTRYFGGIKLGAGGLIRAYSSTVADTLKTVQLKEIVEVKQVTLIFDYPFYDIILNRLNDYKPIKQNFSDKVSLSYEVNTLDLDALTNDLINITNNNIIINHDTNSYYSS